MRCVYQQKIEKDLQNDDSPFKVRVDHVGRAEKRCVSQFITHVLIFLAQFLLKRGTVLNPAPLSDI